MDSTLIKKYKNRRLYNTQTSCYITLHDLLEMIRRHEPFHVVCSDSGIDVTYEVMVQLLLLSPDHGQSVAILLRRLIAMQYQDDKDEAIQQWLQVTSSF